VNLAFGTFELGVKVYHAVAERKGWCTLVIGEAQPLLTNPMPGGVCSRLSYQRTPNRRIEDVFPHPQSFIGSWFLVPGWLGVSSV
jgi:hypothetical protein